MPSRALVLRVNELFHDLEGENYDAAHPEIFQREKRRWERMLDQHLVTRPSGDAQTILDIGCGTGFVGILLLPRLQRGSTIICADISQEKLTICERNLSGKRPDITLQFLKTSDEFLTLPDASLMVVTLNSTLHHVPDPDRLLSEILRVLKPGGLLFIGHEPNRRFFESSFLLTQYLLLHHLTPKRIAAILLKTLGLYRTLVRPEGVDPQLQKINETLLHEGLIRQPLSQQELSSLIDIHSPTAGGLHRERGFDVTHFLDRWNDRLTIMQIETYNHLAKLSGTRFWLRPYEWLLSRLFPMSGATFFLVAQKQS